MGSKIGWFTTGRDLEAVELLKKAYQATEERKIDGQISFIFLNREQGEGGFSDKIIEMATRWSIPVLCLSSLNFRPELRRKESMEEWREEYHKRVFDLISNYEVKFSVLAGYMLIVSPSMCGMLNMINLHPASPNGPAGTWQEVIWQLISTRAGESGVTIHKVIPELDKGPPITYCLYGIKDDKFTDLWNDLDKKLESMSLKQVIASEGEKNALFRMIREEGVKRESPLLLETISGLSSGKLEIRGDMAFLDNKAYKKGICMNTEIESILDH